MEVAKSVVFFRVYRLLGIAQANPSPGRLMGQIPLMLCVVAESQALGAARKLLTTGNALFFKGRLLSLPPRDKLLAKGAVQQ